MMILLEGLVMAFWLLLICVVGIANGPVGLVIFYEQDVQNRVVELGLTTKDRIRKTMIISGALLFVPLLTAVPAMVYGLNGTRGFREGFWQMTAILYIMNLFDRIFIDWFWVGHTKAWTIPGTEDLQPYIPRRAVIRKWVGSMIGFPLLAAIIAGIASLLLH